MNAKYKQLWLLVPGSILLAGLWGMLVAIVGFVGAARVYHPELMPFIFFGSALVALFVSCLILSSVAILRARRNNRSARLPLISHLTVSVAFGSALGFAFVGICTKTVVGSSIVVGMLNTPGFLLMQCWETSGLPFPSGDAGWAMFPFGIVIQWTIVGLITGIIVSLMQWIKSPSG